MNDVLNSKKSARAKVIFVLECVLAGQSLAVLLDDLLASVKADDKAFVHELTLGTLRQWWALSRIGERLIERAPDQGVSVALNVGLYQLLYMNTPDYAAISATLDALKELNKAHGVGLVNAILRKVAKSPAKYAKKIQKNHSLPNHLAKRLKQDWGEHYDELGQVLRVPAPIFLRVNTAKICHEDYVVKLADSLGKPVDEVAQVQLTTKVQLQKNNPEHIIQAIGLSGGSVANLAGFHEGQITAQDLHAQLSGAIVSALTSQFDKDVLNLLDACTAPAGKLTHWLATLSDDVFHVKQNFTLTAIDNDEKRLKQRVYENIDRLGFGGLIDKNLFIKTADATTFKGEKPFDVIMLDAPCSATGVIRRHPDINLLRTLEDIENVVNLQAEILDNLWQHVAQGGFLLYITCSILKAENEEQMVKFLARHKDATEIKLGGDWGMAQQVGRQCLPQMGGGDGFYYALVQKGEIEVT